MRAALGGEAGSGDARENGVEFGKRAVPAVLGQDEVAAARAQPGMLPGGELKNPGGEIRGLVGDQQVASVTCTQALRGGRGGDDGRQLARSFFHVARQRSAVSNSE